MKVLNRLTLFSFIFTHLLIGQNAGKISGTVVDAKGVGLVGANVVVEGTSVGATVDADGAYTIINVPVGDQSVAFKFIGFKTQVFDNVIVSNGLTTVLNATMSETVLEGDLVRVVAEKPLVKRDATNTKRTVNQDVIESLPLRSVDAMVGLQAGVVDNHVRGGRDTDNAYYVDGVLMKDHWGGGNATGSLSKSGMEEISLEAGGFGAEYGGANGGVINVTTKSGGRTLSGSFESVNDLGDTQASTDPNKIYSYGYSLNNFEVGGPIGDALSFYVMVEQEKRADANPSYGSHPYADVHTFQSLDDYNTAVYTDTNHTTVNPDVFYYEEVMRDNGKEMTDSTGTYSVMDTSYVVGTNYKRVWGPSRNASSERLRYATNVGFMAGALRLKLGLTGYTYDAVDNWNNNQLLNWDNAANDKSSMSMYYLNGSMTLSEDSYISAVLSMKNSERFDYNGNINSNYQVSDTPWMDYGRRTTEWNSPNYYHRDDGKQALSVQDVVYFTGHGYQSGNYGFRNESQLGLRLDYNTKLGKHELKAGVESYSTKLRVYQISQAYEIYEQISKVDSELAGGNGDGVVTAAEVGDYNGDGTAGTDADLLDWRFSAYRNAYTTNIGYDIFGNETEDYDESSHGSAPGNPVSTRFYLQDQIEYSDVVVKAGLSFESWNPNTQGPDADGDGKADDGGLNNINTTNNRIDRTGWADVEAHTAVHPRLGMSFPITDKTAFRAQYGTYWQEPTLSYVYLSDSRLSANVSQGNMVTTPNPAMKPERTTSYEVGFTQQIGSSAALDVVGFYKEVSDYMQLVNRQILLNGSEFNLAYYGTGDFGVTRGLSFNLSMRRLKGFLADFNYTLMEARGTGSDPASNFNIAWIGEDYPTIINRLDYDQTHTGSVMIDYRTNESAGLLAGVGVNAVYSFGSGKAYTPSAMVSTIFDRGWNRPLSAINAGSMPWYSNLDLRLEKGIMVAGRKLNVYALLLNALNTENVRDVIPTTGRPDTDGWLETAEGQTWLKSQSNVFPDADAAALYNDRLMNPSHYGSPRMLRFGLSVSL